MNTQDNFPNKDSRDVKNYIELPESSRNGHSSSLSKNKISTNNDELELEQDSLGISEGLDFELSNSSIENLELDQDSLELENLELSSDLELELDEDSLELENLELSSDLELELDEDSLELENLELESNQELEIDEGSLELNNLELELDDEVDLENLDGLLEIDSNTGIDIDLDLNSSESIGIGLELAPGTLEDDNNLDLLLNSPPEKPQVVATPIAKPRKTTTSKPVSKAKTFDQTMRVSVRKLDNLNNMIGELVVKRNRLEEDQERLRRFLRNLLNHVQSLGEMGSKMHDLYERSLLEGALLASRQQTQSFSHKNPRSGFNESNSGKEDELGDLELDRFTPFHLLSQDITELIVRVREAASDIQFVVDESDKVTQSLRQVTTQLQEGMNSSRMVAFGQTTDRLPRAVRDISRQLDKQVNLKVEGKEVLIDKMIVENLYNPMTHLVNNAITHGVESPEERSRLGKSSEGTINIRAFIQGNQTVISVSDDGAGIDPERVKNKAVEKQLITWAQAQHLSKQDVYELLFHAGFSTKDKADDFAGRGVGMDVVSTDLKKIRGTIGIESEVGKGTTFTIRLPLVLSICKALICVFNNTRIAFPIDGVEDTKEYATEEIKTNENGVRCIEWNNSLVPFQPLSNLLSYNRQIRRTNIYKAQQDEETISIILLRSTENVLAVQVDTVMGEQEIVIKQMQAPIPKPAGIAGATVLGDGTIMSIGDVLELVEIAHGKRNTSLEFGTWQEYNEIDRNEEESTTSEPTVLVVDDSITVRELLTMSFNKLGYRVEPCRDGQEAWEKLRGGIPCDMIFCDIEMPRMNGLELLSNLQKEENLKSIPVAMLTSRGADKHRQLATDLGASAYLTKPYTDKELMDVAHKLSEISQANKEETVKSERQSIDKTTEDLEKTNPSVLIIDDSVTVRELLSMTFKKAGYEVHQARDGQEAWDKLRGGLECDIAFCDIEMPRMNGLELLSHLQEDGELSSLPVAMLTSRGAQKMRNIAATRGAKGYFVKPYVEETLLEAAQQMMQGEMLIEYIDLDNIEEDN